MAIKQEIIDELLSNAKTEDELFGKEGLLCAYIVGVYSGEMDR